MCIYIKINLVTTYTNFTIIEQVILVAGKISTLIIAHQNSNKACNFAKHFGNFVRGRFAVVHPFLFNCYESCCTDRCTGIMWEFMIYMEK